MNEIMLLGESDPQILDGLGRVFQTIHRFVYPADQDQAAVQELLLAVLAQAQQNPQIALAIPLNIPLQSLATCLNLIYQLRLRQMANPIVVYGFETLQSILQKEPRSLLLGSPRVAYIRRSVPFQDWLALIESLGFQELTSQALEPYLQLKQRQAYLERLDRHELGNLIGVLPFAQAACSAGLIDAKALTELQSRSFQVTSGPVEEYALKN